VLQQNVYAAWVRARALADINASAFTQTPSLPPPRRRPRTLPPPPRRERENKCVRVRESERASWREREASDTHAQHDGLVGRARFRSLSPQPYV